MVAGGRIATAAAVLLVLHAAYSSVHYREFMKSSGHAAEAESTPLDVYVELILAFVLAFLGAYLDSPGFKSIHATADDNVKTMDMFMENREFAVFNHRGPQLRQRLAGGQAAQ